MSSPVPHSIDQLLAPVYIRANRLMTLVVVLLFLSSMGLAGVHQRWLAALAVGLPLMALALAAIRLAPTTLCTRLLVSTVLMGFAGLQIHLLAGMIEAHFAVFILLSLVLLYRDWRPAVMAAGVIAAHHLLFGFWQSRGGAVDVMPTHHLAQGQIMAMVILHAAYVVVETAMLVAMSRLMRREAIMGVELGAMGSHIGREPGQFDLAFDERHMWSPLGGSFRRTMLAVRSTLSEVVDSLLALSRTGETIAGANDQLAARTREASDALERATASLAQLGERGRDNAASADTASERMRQADTLMTQGNERVARLTETMRGMRDSAGRIADITSLIDGIAFQTHILSLNASVEAARAGESGRGFAVVAKEVGVLAQQSADASRQIAGVIEATQQQVNESSQRAEEVTTTMANIGEQVRQVNALMDEIRHASEAQRQAGTQIDEEIRAISRGARGNGALVDGLSESVESLRHQSRRLRDALDVFTLEQASSRGNSATPRALHAGLELAPPANY
ncbi:methyl-accepting chemotaxis protein [Salinicola sp. DM10]|uniref:methyl-accepting chemotaxis protein n=1 Tax=Salinicola sp. DM10 TaxID=2815721 RepID=UPI001A9061FC|nr:methyl-accepting chemotaxis protein [Salinicola sp. DM10]MCE3027896.1 methyl-accepting chemotaxis protein [Salinicola sp. DM10]